MRLCHRHRHLFHRANFQLLDNMSIGKLFLYDIAVVIISIEIRFLSLSPPLLLSLDPCLCALIRSHNRHRQCENRKHPAMLDYTWNRIWKIHLIWRVAQHSNRLPFPIVFLCSLYSESNWMSMRCGGGFGCAVCCAWCLATKRFSHL